MHICTYCRIRYVCRLFPQSPRGAVRGEQVEERPGRQRLGPEHAGPRQAPVASSSRATTGLTAVCQTTACEPYSRIDHSLSTTW